MGLDVQFDLGDFQALGPDNEGNRYLLLGIDVLSRQMFAVPTKSKGTKDMKEAFEDVFKQMPRLPQQIYTDRGLEFESAPIKAYFEEKGIQKFASKNSKIKAGVAERAIRTIKNR
jgi:hypothetical protein